MLEYESDQAGGPKSAIFLDMVAPSELDFHYLSYHLLRDRACHGVSLTQQIILHHPFWWSRNPKAGDVEVETDSDALERSSWSQLKVFLATWAVS